MTHDNDINTTPLDATGQDSPLRAHSQAEACFYLMITPCTACQQGPLRPTGWQSLSSQTHEAIVLTAVCDGCGTRQQFRFDAQAMCDANEAIDPDAMPTVSHSDQPSDIIGLGQWIALFHIIVHAASQQTEPAEVRRLGFEASLCLDEALKFYDEDSTLPPERAFYDENYRQRFHEHPQQFLKEKLLAWRDKLPSSSAMTTQLARDRADATQATGQSTRDTHKVKPWWKFWA